MLTFLTSMQINLILLAILSNIVVASRLVRIGVLSPLNFNSLEGLVVHFCVGLSKSCCGGQCQQNAKDNVFHCVKYLRVQELNSLKQSYALDIFPHPLVPLYYFDQSHRGYLPKAKCMGGGVGYYNSLPDILTTFKKISKNFFKKIFYLKNLHMSKYLRIFASNFIADCKG